MHRLAAPIRLVLHPSILLRTTIVALSVLAVVAVHLSQLSDVWILLLVPLTWLTVRRVSTGLPVSLILRGDGSVEQIDVMGNAHPVEALGLHERGPFGVLVLEVDGRCQSLPWAADSLSRALRRDLRLWMRDHVRAVESKTASSLSNSSSPE